MTSLSQLALLVFAQTPGTDSATTDAASAVQINSILDFVVKGGPVMIPIGICSLVAFTVVIERLISLRRRSIIPPSFMPGLNAALNTGDRQAALDYCKRDGSPVSRVFAAGIKRLGEPLEIVERHVQEAGQREAIKLRKFLRVLALIGTISTLLGLLGTIMGMITAFQTVAASGEALGRTESLAKGIYEAMITTAAGLIVAIPVQVCYHWIASKIDGLVQTIDQMAADFIEEHAQPRSTTVTSLAAHAGVNGKAPAAELSPERTASPTS